MKLDSNEENVCVAREGVVKLLGCFRLAVVLEQLIYWSNKTKDYDRFLEEEIELLTKDGGKSDLEKRYGWIYKSAIELSEELMGIGAPSTIAKDLAYLEELGYIESRSNPKYKWDHTKQYRPNYGKIQKDLLELGYIHDKIGISQSMLIGYRTCSTVEKSISTTERSSSTLERTIPETTTKITPETTPVAFEEKNSSKLNKVPIINIKDSPETSSGGNGDASHKEMVKALEDLTGMDMKIKSNAGRIVKLSKELREAGYTAKDVRDYGKRWQSDWRYKQDHRPPTIANIKAEIGISKKKPNEETSKLEEFRKMYRESKGKK